jgi:hypothetical protein
MIAGGLLTGGQLASFAMYTMSVSSGITATMKVYSRIMEVESGGFLSRRRWERRSECSS